MKVDDLFPDFFIAGAPKCGTTSLYAWLSQHKQTYMPVKEPSYFSSEIREVPEKSLQEYLALFSGVDKSDNRLIGEASPKYLYSKNGLELIKKYNPEAKIIIMVRNPTDLVLSYHAQMLKEGMEDIVDFRKAWDAIETRKLGNKLPKLCSWPSVLDYQMWGQVGTHLMQLSDIFDDRNILVISLSEMSNDPKDVFSRVCDFLGISHDVNIVLQQENKRKSYRSYKLNRTLIYFRGLLLSIFPNVIGKGTGFIKLINRYNVETVSKKSEKQNEIRTMLDKHFARDKLIMERLGYDISK